ncbi:MAG: MFS transporter [Gammaproteobacteria bacterium]|jgi:MFS transporter, DHA1 family, inner membrane transport protein|nr:MFS transporter [Gammaproteobacteria bacterium]
MPSIIRISEDESFRALLAGALLYTIGPAAILLMPMIVGVYIDELGFTNKEAGFLASAEAMGMAIASILGLFWIRKLNWHYVAFIGLVTSMLANFAATEINSFIPMIFCRFLASVSAGTAFAVSIASLGEQREPERAYGVGLAVQTALLILMLALSSTIINRWGIDGLFSMLALLSLLVALPVVCLPKRSEKGQQPELLKTSNNILNTGSIMLVLLATLVHFIGTVGFWTYLERIADMAGHSTALIGTVLALALGAGMLGGSVAAWLSDRFGFAWPFAISTVFLVISVALAVGDINVLLFAISAIVFDFMWVFANAYQIALVARLDTGGRFVVLVPAAQGIGAMAGPAIAAVFIQGDYYLPVNIMAIICFIFSLFLFLIVLPKFKNSGTT